MPSPQMHKYHYPIETEEAKRFWASRHKCNRMKAIIAFSEDLPDANFNLRRMGFQAHLRFRAINAYKNYVARPSMLGIPFTPATIPWYECLPKHELPPPSGKYALWLDDTVWVDVSDWEEWKNDPVPPAP